MKVAVAYLAPKFIFMRGEEVIEIKDSVIRGEQSAGMICAGEEGGKQTMWKV